MASLFVPVVMSFTWTALVATEAEPPAACREATTAGVLVALAAGILVDPADLPWLVVPDARDTLHPMPAME